MTNPTITITAAPKFQTSNDAGDYRERAVTVQIGDDSVTRDMCDPNAGWQSVDQWISDVHYEALEGAGMTHAQIVEVMRSAWHATSGIPFDVEIEP